MKLSTITLFLSLSVCLICTTASFAQYGNKDSVKIKAADTAKIAIEGRHISQEIVLLRDSITQTIDKIHAGEGKAIGKNKDKLRQAGHNLTLHKQRLETDIKEIFTQTSANGWNNDLIRRVRDDSGEVRKAYKLIQADIKNYMVTRS
jgi:hypothetical protein